MAGPHCAQGVGDVQDSSSGVLKVSSGRKS